MESGISQFSGISYRFSCFFIFLSLAILSCRICKDIVQTARQRESLGFVVITVGK